MDRIFRYIPATMLMFALSGPGSAEHLRHSNHDASPSLRQSQISLDEAAARVRERTGGQILSAQEKASNGDRYYRFKVKKHGRVRVFYLRPDGTPFKPHR